MSLELRPSSGASRRLARLAAGGTFLLSVLGAATCGRGGGEGSAGAGSDASAAKVGNATRTSGGGGPSTVACAPDNGGISLPQGFCASVFADAVGGARHITVAPNGDVFVALQTAAKPQAGAAAERGQTPTGGILALRDTNGDGKADRRELFGRLGGTGVGLHGGFVYADGKTEILRYRLPAGSLRPSGEPEAVVSGIPTGGHGARNFAIDSGGSMYVNVGSFSNSCQVRNRTAGSPGHDPCTELETRAGIWRFDANRTGQSFSPEARWATGIRNAVALGLDPRTGALYAAQHGRDQLHQHWPRLYDEKQGAELPAEEFMRVERGDDFGWPYCYYDHLQRKRVLAPEYGGDGTTVGRCAEKKDPLVTFPGHWGPNGLLVYTGSQFPRRYHGGAFIAFHGSWNRAPLPQAGYNVAFVPMSDGRPSGEYEIFADGFAGEVVEPRRADHRPSGLAQGPDGSLYITDDAAGRIWRVVYTGAGR